MWSHVSRNTISLLKPVCFGSSKVAENRDGFYIGRCLICRFEDECIGEYLGSIGRSPENYFGVRLVPEFVPAIVLIFRHSDYNTLHDKVVEPAITLARKMGLGVQGPVFLPTANMARSARVLVRGPATELVRYTKAVELLPRYGAQVDVRLERIAEMVGTGRPPGSWFRRPEY